MKDRNKTFELGGLTISYRGLGTISVEEFLHAVAEDIHALKGIYHVCYVTAPRIKLLVTNEYGEPIKVRRPTGGKIVFMDTHHYRPACKDYEL